MEAEQVQRQKQQGLGRGEISMEFNGYRMGGRRPGLGNLPLYKRSQHVAGQMACAVMPCSAVSRAIVFVKPTMPCLAET